MNCQPQKEISKVPDFPDKELGQCIGAYYNASKPYKKKEKSIIISGD